MSTSTSSAYATPATNDTDSGSSGSSTSAETPFAADSVFNLPLGSDAQWQSNGQLQSASAYINTADVSNYNENIYVGSSSDPLVTVTDNASAGGTATTFQVHIPADAVPASGGDHTLSVNDTSSGTWYSFGGFQWTGSDTATVNQGSAESDSGNGLGSDNSNADEGVGTLTESDLQSGTIDHMLRMELPTDMLESYTDNTNQLAPYAWPQTSEDGFAVNGNGGPAYSGTIPYGVTVGIPQGTAEPADVAANAGANMLWQALQDHGAMVRDSTGGSGNTAVFQADQNVSGNDPLVLGMEQYSSQIMAATEILTNQGPNSVNGGGTPVVPLDGSSSGGSGASDGTTATAAATTTPTPTPTPTSATSSNDTVVTAGGNGGITDASGNNWTITSGGQVADNGTTISSTSNVTELAYVNGTVWQENSSNNWYSILGNNGTFSTGVGPTAVSPLPAATTSTVTIPQGQDSTTVSQDQVSVAASSGNNMLFVSGTGDEVNLTGGNNTITDTGSGNSYVIPAAGQGSDTFTSNILTAGDTLDLSTALAATTWNGSASTLSNYLSVANSAQGAVLSIAPTSGGSATAIATINGANNASLTTLLAHAIA